MKTVKYKIKIKGLKTPSGIISMLALKELSQIFIESSEKALRLIVEGTSTKKGPIPGWIRSSLEFNITGIKKGSTIVEIEAPQLGETAKEKIAQLNLYSFVPEPNDTAITVWAKSYKDAVKEKYESEIVDRGLLSSMISFKDYLNKYADSIILDSPIDKEISNINVDIKNLRKVEKLTIATPEPKVLIVSGLVNVIEHISSRFTINLDNGEKIQGEIDKNYIDQEKMRNFWGKRVTMRGTAEFRPNGKIRFIRTDFIKEYEEKEIVFKDYLIQQNPKLFIEEAKKLYSKSSPLKEIWNKWTGDETIEEILSDLNE